MMGSYPNKRAVVAFRAMAMSKRLPALRFVGLCAGLGLLGGPAPAIAETTLKVPYERYRLGNGMSVILHEDHRLPTVVVDIWYRVGSKDERVRRTGFAHLFEHLMFMGTKRVPNGQFDAIMEREGGQNNASTSEDRTNYFESGPQNLLETFLWLEADRLSTLADDMTKPKVDLQRDVVRNERRQSIENRPYGKVELVLPELLYPVGHPYHHPVIGSHADLQAATTDDVKQFFRQFYVPSNASLVISGDFKTVEAKRLVDKYFAWMARAPEPMHAAPTPVQAPKAARTVLTDKVELERVVLAWHSPEWFGQGDAEADLLAAVLGGGRSSRLTRALVYDKKLAESVEVEQHGERYDGNFTVTATALQGHTAKELEAAIDAELERLRKEPPTAREVERARAFVETHTLAEIESPFMMADMLNAFEFRFGDPGQLERSLLSRYGKLGSSDVAWIADQVLSAPRVTIAIVPEQANAKAGKRP
jgi:predicted Zn-dependent peptidase